MRYTRSYPSFGLRRFNANCTVSFSSGIKSSALQETIVLARPQSLTTVPVLDFLECIWPCIPQSELPVASSVLVPLAERDHPPLQPRALHDEVGERRLRHLCGGGGRMSCRMALSMDLLDDSSCEAQQARTSVGWSRRGGLALFARRRGKSDEAGAHHKLPGSAARPASNYTAPTRRTFVRRCFTAAFLADDSCSGRACHEELTANGVGAFRSRTTPVLRGAERAR